MVFVAALGLGPIAGTCALAIGSIGFLGKLVADAVEEIDPGPLEAVHSVGGGWWKTLFAAVIPQAMPAMVGSSLYMFDVNVRTRPFSASSAPVASATCCSSPSAR